MKSWNTKLLILILVGALAASLAFWKRRGIISGVQSWRAESLIEKSREAGEKENWEESGRLALAAWQLRAGHYTALSQLFRSALETRSPEVLGVARAVLGHPECTGDDREKGIRLFLDAGDLVTAGRYLSKIAASDWDSAEILELGARYFLARNEPLEALKYIETLCSIRDEPRDLLFAADALVRLTSPEGAQRKRAQEIIDGLFQVGTEPRVAFAAFALLRRIPPEERALERFGDARERLGAFAKLTEVPISAYFLATELENEADPDREAERIAASVVRWRTDAPVALGNWLLSLKKPDLFLAISPEEAALENIDLFLLHVRASILQEDWDKAASLLDNRPSNLDSAVSLALGGIVAEARGERSAGRALWERALEHASLARGRSSLLTMARLAAQSKNVEIRNRAVVEALKRPSSIPLSAEEVSFVFEHLVSKDESSDLLRVSQGLLASEPDNAKLLNNVVWLQVLQGRIDSELIGRLEDQVRNYPKIETFRSTLLLAYLEGNREEEAFALADSLPVDKVNGSSDEAVVALAFARSNRIPEAKKLAASIDWGRIMKQEREWFEAQLNAAGIELSD